MSIEAVVLAVGTEAEKRTERLANGIVAVAGPADAEVGLTHVFGEAAFDEPRPSLRFARTARTRRPTRSRGGTGPPESARRSAPRAVTFVRETAS